MIKNIVITGASSGIGKALYESFKYFGESGEKVIGISRRGPDIIQDLRQPISNKPLVKDVTHLINCAGIMPLDEANGKEIFDVNFWGAFNMIWNLRPSFIEGACITNIASVSGIRPDPELPIYAASKAALISLTKSYAKLFAPHIRVNCISPGFYNTNLVPGEDASCFSHLIPMGYAEEPANLFDIVRAIVKTKYMTGSNIVVDGGVSL